MSLINKPFTIEEIIERFEKFSEHEMMKDRTSDMVPGMTYSVTSWLRRTFPKNDALKPHVKIQKHPKIDKNWLHYNFRIYDKGVDTFEPDKKKANMPNICKSWLSMTFGFFNYEDRSIVQVNPAVLFLYYFFPDSPLDKLIQKDDIRYVAYDRNDETWVWRQFRYYYLSLMQQENYGQGLLQYNKTITSKKLLSDESRFYGTSFEHDLIPVREMREHWLVQDDGKPLQLKYIAEREIMPDIARMDHFLPFGSLILTGWLSSLDSAISNKRQTGDKKPPSLAEVEVGFNEWVAPRVKGFIGAQVYTGGAFAIGIKPPLTKDNFEVASVTEEQRKLAEYLVTYTRKGTDYPTIEMFEEEMRTHQIYSDVLLNRRSVFNDIITKDAKAMGFTLSKERRWNSGKTSRKTYVVIEKPKYGRAKK